MQLGKFPVGRPTLITARVRMGRGQVVDIDREVELCGPLHSKGVLILSAVLGARYCPDVPLSLSASLVFEQSYGGVDGDSASSTELYALLSALADVPLKQSLAVTGSVNQHGQVQAIGGANEKIEGFFDICKMDGLTGEQGVLIPSANVKHLMLRNDVIEAVGEGSFHIWPIDSIDQGIALLTGREAGERDADGAFPTDSINGLVEARLAGFAEAARRFMPTSGGQDAGTQDEQ
jgi:predicted ATP-dependent protease